MNYKKLVENAKEPTRGTPGSAGWDLCAIEEVIVPPNGTASKVRTGIAMEIPEGFFGLLVPRSSMGRKGVRLSTGASIIDSDYRGEILAFFWNDSNTTYTIKPGDRVAQIVLIPYGQTSMAEVEELSETDRSGGGFGSTGR